MPQSPQLTVQITIDASTLEQIRVLLRGAQKPDAPKKQSFDYYSFIDVMMEQEFTLELEKLREWINEPATFAEKFCDICQQKHENPSLGYSFSVFPESPGNKLFREIAKLLHPQDPLAILAPTLKHFYRTELPDQIELPDGNPTSDFLNNTPLNKKIARYTPPLREINRNEIDIDDFAKYAVAGSCLFDVSSLKNLTLLTLQTSFHNHMRTTLPELADRIYNHNGDLIALQEKIDFINRPRTPMQALQRFMDGLRLGGESLSRAENATLGAQHAYLGFLEYLRSLPTNLRNQFEDLRSSGKTIRDVLKDIRENKCVELASTNLSQIMLANKHLISMNRAPNCSKLNRSTQLRQFCTELEKLNIHKDYLGLQLLPIELFKKVISSTNFTNELLINFLTHLPVTYYEEIFANFPNKSKLLFILKQVVNKNLLKDQVYKREVILDYLISHLLKTTTLEKYFLNLYGNPIELFTYPLQKKRSECLELFFDIQQQVKLIELFSYSPKHIYEFFSFLPKEKRLPLFLRLIEHFLRDIAVLVPALKACELSPEEWRTFLNMPISENDPSVWDKAYDKTTTFNNLLQAIPESLRWPLLKEQHFKESFYVSGLYKSTASADEIAMILNTFPQADQQEIVSELFKIDSAKQDLLNKAKGNLELYKVLQKYLSASECQSLVTTHYRPLWLFMVRDGEALHDFVTKIPFQERFTVLEGLQRYGDYFFEELGKANSALLFDILELLPEEDKSKALGLIYSGTRILGYAVRDPRFIRTFFSTMKREEWNQWLKLTHNRQTILEVILQNPAALAAFLSLIPLRDENRLNFLLDKGDFASAPIHMIKFDKPTLIILEDLFADNKEQVLKQLLQARDNCGKNILYQSKIDLFILGDLSNYDLLETLQNQDNQGNTLLHEHAHSYQNLNYILKCFKYDEQIKLLMITNQSGETVFERAAGDSQAIEYLIKLLPEDKRSDLLDSLPALWPKIYQNPLSINLVLPLVSERHHYTFLRNNPQFINELPGASIPSLISFVSEQDYGHLIDCVLKVRKCSNDELYEYHLTALENVHLQWRRLRELVAGIDLWELRRTLNNEDPEIKIQILSETIKLFKKTTAKVLTKSMKEEHIATYSAYLDGLPKISENVKKVCIALACTIVGLIPAAIILTLGYCGFFNKREIIKDQIVTHMRNTI